MRPILLSSFLLVFTPGSSRPVTAAGPPLVEPYLHAGELAKGQQALEDALATSPKDDQIRFGLAVIQFLRGVERLGQSLYEYGVKSENAHAPFLRLPVPTNPDPATVRYATFRRLLDDFNRDLAAAERTLAGVTDDTVKLPLRLAAIRLDLTGNGKPTDRFLDLLKKLVGRDLVFLQGNPDFLVCFDRGDVAWLRAYCHLLMGMLDFYLAFDTAALFDLWADEVFARPQRRFAGKPEEKWQKQAEVGNVIRVQEPARLGRFLRHLLQVCELNRETWRYIRAETDDDHEWLPNPKQKGVLGLPVRDGMIDVWLDAVAEVGALLEGKKLLPNFFGAGKGINLRKVLDDPPAQFNVDAILKSGVADKYLAEGETLDVAKLFRVARVFDNTMAVAYAAWFN